MTTSRIAALLFAGALVLAACGDDDTTAESLPVDDGSGAAGACLAEDPDCDDIGDSSDDPQLEPGDEDGAPPAQGMCLPDEPDCEDTVVVDNDADGSADRSDDPDDLDAQDEELRQAAKALLGTPEGELGEEVRIARRGSEDYALTDDYRVGRMTVELDDDGTGTFVVVSVTVELNGPPETFTAEA